MAQTAAVQNVVNTTVMFDYSNTTPASTTSSNNTYLMSDSPVRSRRPGTGSYKPKIITTVGAKPACLVNASVTYVGNDLIYAFGGFDQYTDEGMEMVRSRSHDNELTV